VFVPKLTLRADEEAKLADEGCDLSMLVGT